MSEGSYIPLAVGEGYFSDWQSPSIADDGKIWIWNHAQQKYVPQALSAGLTDHARLTHLDFASSGHTGFEAEGAGAAAVAAHVALADPHGQYLLADGSRNGAAASQAQTFTSGVKANSVQTLDDSQGFKVRSSNGTLGFVVDTNYIESSNVVYVGIGADVAPDSVLTLQSPNSGQYILGYKQASNKVVWENWIEDGGYGGDSGSIYYDFWTDDDSLPTVSGAIVLSPFGRIGINIGYAPVEAGLHIVCGDAVLPGLLIKLHANSSEAIQFKNPSDAVIFGIGIDGKIKTNQSVANTHTPSGATAKALPIYDVAGTLLGYIPIYGSAW